MKSFFLIPAALSVNLLPEKALLDGREKLVPVYALVAVSLTRGAEEEEEAPVLFTPR